MKYGKLFEEIDTNIDGTKPKTQRKRRNKTHRRRQRWEESCEPSFFYGSLFPEPLSVHPEDELTDEELTPEQQQERLERLYNVVHYTYRHEQRAPLFSPPLKTKPIDYATSLLELAQAMRLQELADKGKLRFASGVFLADKRRPEKGYRVQVWDNVKEKKQHVCYTKTKEEGILKLRQYWEKKGVNTEVKAPAYFEDLVREAIQSKHKEVDYVE